MSSVEIRFGGSQSRSNLRPWFVTFAFGRVKRAKSPARDRTRGGGAGLAASPDMQWPSQGTSKSGQTQDLESSELLESQLTKWD